MYNMNYHGIILTGVQFFPVNRTQIEWKQNHNISQERRKLVVVRGIREDWLIFFYVQYEIVQPLIQLRCTAVGIPVKRTQIQWE